MSDATVHKLFRSRDVAAAVPFYGAERIVCGTDGAEFGCEWISKALEKAEIDEDARAKILHRKPQQ